VEAYLKRLPELAVDSQVVLGLIEAECRLRAPQEPVLALEEFLGRFPRYRAELPGRLLPFLTSRAGAKRPAEVRMIAFACAHCGMKLQVKPEFAGRSSRCPTCKQPLVVPDPDQTTAYMPPERLDGPASVLVQTGVPADVTLETPAEVGPVAQPGRASVAALLARRGRDASRYVLEGEIARGGMGAVLRAVDRDIRREVAVKYLLDQASASGRLRFVEEAQITGQLEHPNIVPIHELGRDALGRLFFTMKLVKGRSLAQVLEGLRGEPGATRHTAATDYTLGRLLTILVNVCHALAYAHARGVIHRDLKPGNIMVGDFGEVYVMDWGLAKVRNPRAGDAGQEAGAPPQAIPLPASKTAILPPARVAAMPAPMAVPMSDTFTAGSGSSRATAPVVTDRVLQEELTRAGAIMGTPVYMAPEQAVGRIEAIDQRSDVYALGAILYEILTLQPPVETAGGGRAILMRVANGEIVPLEQRIRQTHRKRRVPAELAAMAMKALSKEPAQRYPTVEAFRRDLELYLEGRSVSAKEDTRKEMLIKFVKRNKGFSAATAGALVVLAVVVGLFLRANLSARLRAEESLAAFQQEQERRREQNRHSAPLFYQDARVSTERGKLENALAQVTVAVDYDPELAQARLLKGQILLAQKAFAEAQAELDTYHKQRPGDEDAAELARRCRQARAEDYRTLVPVVDALVRQKAFTLAEHLQGSIAGLEQKEQRQLELYRKRIESAWPGLGGLLTMDGAGKLHMNLYNQGSKVKDLIPLRGLPLTSLSLINCVEVRDLTPLEGMKLTSLDLSNCKVRDLTPLKGVPLTF
jgi:serine/threonine protein kinase